MKFGLFYEHQLPRPWGPDSEHQLLKDALEQVELADKGGMDCVWEVEHHFLEEYSHSSAPEVFLAAASQRTNRIRLVPPRPRRRPRPPMWVACSRRETIQLAAELGIGALSFSFIEPEEAKQWVDGYYDTIQSEKCVAGGFSVNPNLACVMPMMV